MGTRKWWEIRPTQDGNQACKLCGDYMGEGDPDNPYCWKTASPINVDAPGKPLPCFTAMPSDVEDEKVFKLLENEDDAE